VEALVVEPPHPLQSRQLDLFNTAPGALFLDQFGLEQGELGFSQSIDAPMFVNS
jgi:hypothetical protein